MAAIVHKTSVLKPLHTNWHVLTGAPCAGKTTLIEMLAGRGYRVVHEVARAYIDGQLSQGRTLAQIKADPAAFERTILLEKVRGEKALPPEELIFLDRAVPDSIAYYRFEGLDPDEPLSYSRSMRYKTIFLLDRLLFQKDAVRSESEKAADLLDALIAQAYAGLGYEPVRVPVLPVDQRLDFILQRAFAR